MQPIMSNEETALFVSFVRNCSSYLEFGSGGSTYVASQYVRGPITSIDSSRTWLDRVAEACAASGTTPELQYVDIGATGDWGYPTDPSTEHRWPDYHTRIWSHPGAKDTDLYLVDGRFRVACFAQITLHCRKDAIIGIHDFTSREQYHCVKEIGREIATSGDISFFLPLDAKQRATTMLQAFSTDPA